jgi:hypothetical protein
MERRSRLAVADRLLVFKFRLTVVKTLLAAAGRAKVREAAARISSSNRRRAVGRLVLKHGPSFHLPPTTRTRAADPGWSSNSHRNASLR